MSEEIKNQIKLKSINKDIIYDISVKSKNAIQREIDNLRKEYDRKSKTLATDILKYSAECIKKNQKIDAIKITELTEANNKDLSIIAEDITALNNLSFDIKKQISIVEKKIQSDNRKLKDIEEEKAISKWIENNKDAIAKIILTAKRNDKNFTNSKIIKALKTLTIKTTKEE